MTDKNVHLFAIDADELKENDIFDKAFEIVSPERQSKVLRLKNEDSKRLSLAAGLIKTAAFKCAGKDIYAPIEIKKNEKPYLKGNDSFFFNLSHSGNIAVCAISHSEIGCDIERIREDRKKVAQRFFTEEEQRFVSEKEGNFFRMWTLKESFIKVTGMGLSLPLTDFSINAKDADNITIAQSVDGRSYTFKEYFCFDGYACSVCAAGLSKENFDEDVNICHAAEIIEKMGK